MTTTTAPGCLVSALFTLLFLSLHVIHIVAIETDDKQSSDAALFEPSKEIYALGPSAFPPPTQLYLPENAIPIAKPWFGEHRPNQDAVFAYAEGYVVGHYILFLKTLRDTGFDGDVVLAIADEPQEGVEEYLKQQDHVVVYKASLKCFDSDGITQIGRTKKAQSHDVFQMCQLANGIYASASDGTPLQDARGRRVVATLRYEWYWIWSLHYNADQWIMLVDARDTVFQTNPFSKEKLPRSSTHGILYFFGENTNVTRLGRSRHNAKWLRNGYGEHVVNALADKPTICSGSTMGNQRAISTYLRAMVNEWDETDIQMTGSDQGFHNYLYYSGKLQNAHNISQLVVWEQGKGIINNLGALRTKPLSEWGIYNNVTHQVFNWDQSLSPVVHQWDRDQHLFRYTTQQRMRQLVREWKKENRQGKQDE